MPTAAPAHPLRLPGQSSSPWNTRAVPVSVHGCNPRFKQSVITDFPDKPGQLSPKPLPKDFLSFLETSWGEGEEGETPRAPGAGAARAAERALAGAGTSCSRHFSPSAGLGPSLNATG